MSLRKKSVPPNIHIKTPIVDEDDKPKQHEQHENMKKRLKYSRRTVENWPCGSGGGSRWRWRDDRPSSPWGRLASCPGATCPSCCGAHRPRRLPSPAADSSSGCTLLLLSTRTITGFRDFWRRARYTKVIHTNYYSFFFSYLFFILCYHLVVGFRGD